MRDKEILGLHEAYLQVHAHQEEVEQLDEISKRLASDVVLARIGQTGDAHNREMKNRTRENMMASQEAGRKEARAKRLAAGVRSRRNANEEVDLFDAILDHLIAEGYADTEEAATAIMANMSEEWRQSILEQNATDSMADRARLAVGHQRAGTLGDADLKNKIKQSTAPRPKPTSTPNTAASWVGGV